MLIAKCYRQLLKYVVALMGCAPAESFQLTVAVTLSTVEEALKQA